MSSVQQFPEEMYDGFKENVATVLEEKHDFYNAMDSYDNHHHERISSTGVARVTEAVEDAMTTYLSLETQIRNSDMLEDYGLQMHNDEAQEFANLYSLYAAGKKGAEALGRADEEGGFDLDVSKFFLNNYGEKNLDRSTVFGSLTSKYIHAVDTAADSEDELVEVTADYFNSLVDACHREMTGFPDYLKEARDLELEIDGTIINGFSKGLRSDFITKDVAWDDVVGNDDIKAILQDSIDELMDYDPDGQYNPNNVGGGMTSSVLIDGPPGTGKTYTLSAAANEASQLAEEEDMPLTIESVDDRILSKYKGEMMQNMRGRFEKVMDPDGIGLLFMEDVESMFPPRNQLENEPEEKKAHQALLNLLEGMETEERGNYLIVATTNLPEELGEAMKSRFDEQEAALGPQTQEEYEEIIDIRLQNNVPDRKVQVDDYSRLAEKAREYGFTGRNINNLIKNLAREKRDRDRLTEEQREILKHGDKEEKIEVAKEKYEAVTEDDIETALDDFHETLERQEQEAREERIKRRLESRQLDEEVDEYWEEMQEDGLDLDELDIGR